MITEIPAPVYIRRIARTQSSTTRNYTPEFSTFERIAGVNPSESAMDRPHPGGSAVMITEIPAPGYTAKADSYVNNCFDQFIRRIARTQSSTTRNYTPEFSTFERIAGSTHPKVQWTGLTLGLRRHDHGNPCASFIRRIARTQSSTTRNYTPEFSTFERIAGSTHPKVQWTGLTLGLRRHDHGNPCARACLKREKLADHFVVLLRVSELMEGQKVYIRRIARTQSSTTRNYTPEFSTFERIAGVNPSESAMDRPHPGGSAVMITEIPAPAFMSGYTAKADSYVNNCFDQVFNSAIRLDFNNSTPEFRLVGHVTNIIY
ncbi:hypothetical protein BSL78_09546 [Apostichopus japonicus]|uniref:Uncharacterized protein n=1 Tax=Stichopus japonicus TaxID=307972 RepID=A0A2G8KZZ3_STIJA|nr:hypothetical protein BSL78_09546 [Apostichopus japonicus]